MLEKRDAEEQKCDSSWFWILLGEAVLWFLSGPHSAHLCYYIKHYIIMRITPWIFSV